MHDLKSTCEMHGVPELMEVAAIIDSLEFKEKPDYNLIKFQLTKILLDMDICPDQDYNWDRQSKIDSNQKSKEAQTVDIEIASNQSLEDNVDEDISSTEENDSRNFNELINKAFLF